MLPLKSTLICSVCVCVCIYQCTLGLRANRGPELSPGLTVPWALWCQCPRHLEASHTYTWGPVATRATCHLATPAGQWHLSSRLLQSQPVYPRFTPMACCHTPCHLMTTLCHAVIDGVKRWQGNTACPNLYGSKEENAWQKMSYYLKDVSYTAKGDVSLHRRLWSTKISYSQCHI